MAQAHTSQQPQGIKNHIETVAVVGAGGHVGKFIVESLLQTGKHKVTALTRADSTSAIPTGATVVRIDYDDHASLVSALRGHDALVITMGARAPPEQQTKLIEAAAAADVAWILPNEWGYDKAHPGLRDDIPLGGKHAACTALVERLGRSSWIGVTCGFWYEWSLGGGPYCYGFDIPNRAVTFFDDGNTRVNTSTWPQCGRAVAGLLSLKILPDDDDGDDDGGRSACLSRYRNQYVYISSFNVNQRDMLDSVMRVTGTAVGDWKISHEDAAERYRVGVEEMRKGNLRGFAQLMYTRVFYRDGGGEFEASKGLLNGVLGLPREDMNHFTGIAVQRAKEPFL